jgi:hypothetical protein
MQSEESLKFRRKLMLASSAFLESYSKASKKEDAGSATQLFILEQVNGTNP